MNISENAVREAVGRLLDHLERMQAWSKEDAANLPQHPLNDAYYKGVTLTRAEAIDSIRRELADYLPEPLPCGCGNPAVGKDETGAPICAVCSQRDSTRRSIENRALQSIPTQPTRSDR